MESTLSKACKKDGQLEDSLLFIWKDLEFGGGNSLGFPVSQFKKLARRVKFYCELIGSTKKLQIQTSQRGPQSLTNSIPKPLVSFDERYLQHFLKLIHISASKAASCNISMNLGQSTESRMGISFEDSISPSHSGSCDLTSFVVECPLPAGPGNMERSPPGHWIIGSVTQSKSMINILKSSLFRQYVTPDSNANSKSLFDVEGSLYSDGILNPLPKFQNEITLGVDGMHGSEKGHESFFSISSTNSSWSDRSSTSSTCFGLAAFSQGRLQCTWKCGVPHYVFSTDNQGEVYQADLLKLDSSDDKTVDYAYLFHLGVSGQIEQEAYSNELPLVGKMKVSSSFTLCPNNTIIMETEFVLFGPPENQEGEVQTSGHRHTKSLGFTRKVAKAFRTGRGSHKKTTSKFVGTNTVPENHSWEPCSDICNDNDQSPSVDLLGNDLPPNLESIAIVARNHLHKSNKKVESGWGLKFLKKNRVKKAGACLETTLNSDCCPQSPGGCSMSMEILVPAGFHGGPRTSEGGPSNLIQRWKSGGVCDCGGWDTGCALTVLNARSSKEVNLILADAPDECKSFDIFIQGSEQSVPTLRMVKLHDDAYNVHFKSSLSALQSFSIAVAIRHMQCPTLRPKNML